MKIVRLTIAMITAALLVGSPFCVYGQEPVAPPERVQPPTIQRPVQDYRNAPQTGACAQQPCNQCNQCCNQQPHNQCCQQQQCMRGVYGYGQACACQPDRSKGPCQIHGNAPCEGPGRELGNAVRQAFGPADRPLLGMRPIYPNDRMRGMYAPVPPGYANGGPGMYGPNGIAGFGGYGMYGRDMIPAPGMNGQWGLTDRPQPKREPHCPWLRSIFCPEPAYMTTSPVPPMPTYQTRGPRDFFLDPSVKGFGDIGY